MFTRLTSLKTNKSSLVQPAVLLTVMSQCEDTMTGLSPLVLHFWPGNTPMMLTPDWRLSGSFHL